MARSLSESPNIEHLKKQAKAILKSRKSSDPKITLAEAQQAVAKEYGYKNWAALKSVVENVFSSAEKNSTKYYEDYRWNNALPEGVNEFEKLPTGKPFFKFINLTEGLRVEYFNASGIFEKICFDPKDLKTGNKKKVIKVDDHQYTAMRFDSAGQVVKYEKYFLLTNDEPPLVRSEIFNAEGRLIEIHTPKRISPTAEDIHVTDSLGKLKAILHHTQTDTGVPCKGWDEWM